MSEANRIESFSRLIQIEKFFEDLVSRYDIKNIAIEKLFFTKFNQANAEFVYGVRAILISLFIKKNCNVLEYTPIELKKRIT
ncbi:MAG: crossover junction endodeoxyribonuclease RuvC [Patescibacteria group bacterium]